MKNTLMKIISLALILIISLSVLPGGIPDVRAAGISDYEVGSIIEFGSYPQSRVTDGNLISLLGKENINWISCGYYSGDGSVGSMTQDDCAFYADVSYGGNKYRALKFSSFRPTSTYSSIDHQYQRENGYVLNTVYWFKYEPLRWVVLDPGEGLVFCESIIDSQAYSNTIYREGTGNIGDCYNDFACTNYANDYASSSLRLWLNNDSYNTAFTTEEKSEIQTSLLDNSCSDTSRPKYDSDSTSDKIFLLSFGETIDSSYGFSADRSDADVLRRAKGTDYAKSQGLAVYDDWGHEYYGYSSWWLRSPYGSSYNANFVTTGGQSGYGTYVDYCSLGIRPAFRFSSDFQPVEDEVITGDFLFGSGSTWSDGAEYTYKYSDSLFDGNSSEYRHDLALMSMVLEASCCVPDGGWKMNASGEMVKNGDDYSGKFPMNAETLFNNIGFDKRKYYGYDSEPGYETIACVVAAKNIQKKDTTVIAVAVRGAGYEAEWAGNFNIGINSVAHQGFNNAKTDVLDAVEDFVYRNKDSFENNVKIWITGYSRAAATANLVAAELNRGVSSKHPYISNLNFTKNQIYCYSFETPQNTTDKNANSSQYNNIFSIVNPIDPVPKVAPSCDGFDFRRYGVTYYLPCAETYADYGKIKTQMNEVYRQIYGKSYEEGFAFLEFSMGELVQTNKSIGQMTYMDNLIDIIAEEALENRENYYENYQSAVQDLMAMFMGGYRTPDINSLTEDLKRAIIEYIKNRKYISLSPVEELKESIAVVLSENTELSYRDSMKLLGKLDELLFALIKHPNYILTSVVNMEKLFYPHHYHVLVGWMAYLETLPDAQRENLLRDNISYRTVKVNCPVDVSVTDSNGDVVSSIVNDEVVDLGDYGLCTYIDESSQKCIVMPFDDDYEIKITAPEKCNVSVHIGETSGEERQNERSTNYYNILLQKGAEITCFADKGEIESECSYMLFCDDRVVVLPDEVLSGDKIEKFSVIAESNIASIPVRGDGKYIKGEFAEVFAENVEGYKFLGWYEGESLVTEENSYRFRLIEDVTFTAHYEKIPYTPETIKESDSFFVRYAGTYLMSPEKYVSASDYTVSYESADESIVTVDSEGNITAVGRGSAKVICTITLENSDKVIIEADVNVDYVWWQWLIVIFLFGWIWY